MHVGLDVMHEYGLFLNYKLNIVHNHLLWSIPITYKHDHCFVQDYAFTILFNRKELEKLHLHFHHPSTDKLFNLLRRYDPRQRIVTAWPGDTFTIPVGFFAGLKILPGFFKFLSSFPKKIF